MKNYNYQQNDFYLRRDIINNPYSVQNNKNYKSNPNQMREKENN